MRSLALLLVSCFAIARASGSELVTLTASDGVQVYGEFWSAPDQRAPIILAFHQAGASRIEYAPLVPRLNRAGFSVLAIDQRSGDGEFGGHNQTVAALRRSTSYAAALPDLEAALAWGKAKANGSPVLVWGSSYSAALAFLLVAKHPKDAHGLLAFSPGEYLNAPNAVHDAAKKVRLPIFIDQSTDSEEIEQSHSILKAIPGNDKQQFVPTTNGVHGSATLRPDRNAVGAEENWTAVLRFLGQFKKP